MKLTTKESMALQAMVRRVGLAPVLDDLSMLAQEMGAAWEDVASVIYDAREKAFKASASEDAARTRQI